MTSAETFTVNQLAEAIKANDTDRVRQILDGQPDLVRTDMAYENEHQVLHYAVYARLPKMVRLLMRCGADARKGIWPHRAATTALVLAQDRGYDEIVTIIGEEENLRKPRPQFDPKSAARDQLMKAFDRNDEDAILRILEADPSLIEAYPWRLHAAACKGFERLAAWLLDHGSDVNSLRGDRTPLDMAAECAPYFSLDRARKMMIWLREHGAELTPRAAVALGETEWLGARHAGGRLVNPQAMKADCAYGGLLEIAALNDRLDMAELLLDLGFDPNERAPIEGANRDSWGGPLDQCAHWGRLAIAETLLKRGADPNPKPHLSKTPIAWAYENRNAAMIELLERYGAIAHPVSIGIGGDIEKAKKLIDNETAGKLPPGFIGPQETLGELLLWSGGAGGHPEIVRLALPIFNLPRDDPRWWWMLWHPLFRSLECFKLVLQHCNPDASLYFGRTILHDIVGMYGRDQNREGRDSTGDAIGFATAVLDAGGRLDIRDELLKSTPLGWACRWGLADLVKLFLNRGADRLELEAEPWATPVSWATKGNHSAVLALLTSRK
jgi:ankyrin repeat protein